MRTTVTLDGDVEATIRRLMAERGLSFKQVLNDAIRAGTQSTTRQPVQYTTVRDLGAPRVNLDAALQLAGQLEDDELIRKMHLGK